MHSPHHHQNCWLPGSSFLKKESCHCTTITTKISKSLTKLKLVVKESQPLKHVVKEIKFIYLNLMLATNLNLTLFPKLVVKLKKKRLTFFQKMFTSLWWKKSLNANLSFLCLTTDSSVTHHHWRRLLRLADVVRSHCKQAEEAPTMIISSSSRRSISVHASRRASCCCGWAVVLVVYHHPRPYYILHDHQPYDYYCSSRY